jgi:Cell morphogenesis C-terminal
MLADMLARLSNTIADEQRDYQTFSLEILTTLKVIIGALDLQDLLRFPQLFWTTCACLDTIHEREFYEALSMLERTLDRLDLTNPAVVKSLLTGKPAKWEGGFVGIQPLVYKGLKSADSLDRTLSVLYRLAALPNNELVGDDDRFLYAILANLPRFLHQLDLDVKESRATACAEQLSAIARVRKLSQLAYCLTRLTRHDYGSGQEFLVSIIGAIRAAFFPQHDSQSLIFMIGLLTNNINWFRVKTMEVLCVLIPDVNMKSPQISNHGPDLISPLLRLLQTDLCPQALEVMDYIMEVSGHPMEKHHMRMSMASGSARAVRKEYESTKSLYGIPLPSGWSIPMPAISSSRTRNNVHAVFYTCGDSEVL